MKYEGLRDWLSIIEQRGELTTLEDVDWNLEMGAVVDVLYREHPPYPPALIFDRIKDHKPGYRALFGHFAAATSSAKQCLPPAVSLLPKLYWNDSLEIKPTAERWIRRTLQFGWEVVEFPGKIRQTDGLFGLAVVAGQISRRDRYSCHANQGLNDYTRDVARRLAKQGYGALAIDFSRAIAVLRRPTLKAKGSAIFASSRFAGSFSRNIYNSNFDVHLI